MSNISSFYKRLNSFEASLIKRGFYEIIPMLIKIIYAYSATKMFSSFLKAFWKW